MQNLKVIICGLKITYVYTNIKIDIWKIIQHIPIMERRKLKYTIIDSNKSLKTTGSKILFIK